MPPFVLASGSPRRRQLLQDLGYVFEVVPSKVDEAVAPGETPDLHVRRLSLHKALTIERAQLDAVVLAADTIVTREGEILGKPEDMPDFERIMRALSGRRHEVMTAVTVTCPETASASSGVRFPRTILVRTEVHFHALTKDEIAWYWATGEPRDKAGGYAIQGLGGVFVQRIDGSHSNVIGLPLVETVELLGQAGIPPPWAPR